MKVVQLNSLSPVEESDLFEMANLRPKHTGLPMTVWVSHGGRARHDARVKVCRTHGDRLDFEDMAVVGIRPTAALVEGPLDGDDLKRVQLWIELNRDVLIGFWDGRLDTVEMLQGLHRL